VRRLPVGKSVDDEQVDGLLRHLPVSLA
jgi:hypothetical protein